MDKIDVDVTAQDTAGDPRTVEAFQEAPDDLLEAMAKEQRREDRYKGLRRVLEDAYLDAVVGKGADRHASAAPFEDQPMLLVRRALGPGFTRGQAMKKTLESRGLEPALARRELLQAIVYLAGEVMALEAEASGA